MTIYTGCPHCGKAISFELPTDRDIRIAPGKNNMAGKLVCDGCKKTSDVFITIMPTGEVHEIL
jgi:hypothetical protein